MDKKYRAPVFFNFTGIPESYNDITYLIRSAIEQELKLDSIFNLHSISEDYNVSEDIIKVKIDSFKNKHQYNAAIWSYDVEFITKQTNKFDEVYTVMGFISNKPNDPNFAVSFYIINENQTELIKSINQKKFGFNIPL